MQNDDDDDDDGDDDDHHHEHDDWCFGILDFGISNFQIIGGDDYEDDNDDLALLDCRLL